MKRKIKSWICLVLGLVAVRGHAQAENAGSVAVWDATVEITGGFGYRKNVLRSSVAMESSTFFLTSVDASLMRLSDSGAFFMLYFFGEDTRYFNAPSVNYEQFFNAAAQGALPLGDKNEIGLLLNYLYQHQIYDASETQDIQRRLLVLGHNLSMRPNWEYSSSGGQIITLDGGAFRQVYEQDLDDYTEGDLRLALFQTYGNRSDIGASCQFLQRYYDTREQSDELGLQIRGTDLIYTQQKLSGDWKHYWDQNRCWRSWTTVSGMTNHDNGAGYYDYDRVLIKEQLRWKNGRWSIKGNARFGWYLYSTQTVGGEKRKRSYTVLDFRIERNLGEHWLLYGTGEYEWDRSNDPLDEYETWMAHVGTGLTF